MSELGGVNFQEPQMWCWSLEIGVKVAFCVMMVALCFNSSMVSKTCPCRHGRETKDANKEKLLTHLQMTKDPLANDIFD